MKGKVSAQDPLDQVLSTKSFICPRGTEGRDKKQRKREKGKRPREREPRYLSWRTKDCFWIERWTVVHRNMMVYKRYKGKSCVRMKCLILIGYC